jgi:hypothetical protein
MEQDYEEEIFSLEQKLNAEGIGIMITNYLLLTPEEGLIFLEAVFDLKLDLAILGTTLWERNEDGDYFELPDIYNFDDIQLGSEFVEYSYRATKKYIESLVGDPTIDRLVIDLESNEGRQLRVDQVLKGKKK